MEQGALYNLTSFEMCAHNGTHVDAPFHFLQEGKTVEAVALEKMVGACLVVECSGDLTAEDAEQMCRMGERRILIKGDAVVTQEAAEVFAKAGVDLLGVESLSVGPEDAPMAVHKILLAAEVVLLEGLRLGDVLVGRYFLCAAPLNLAGADGAPCRAILVEGI